MSGKMGEPSTIDGSTKIPEEYRRRCALNMAVLGRRKEVPDPETKGVLDALGLVPAAVQS